MRKIFFCAFLILLINSAYLFSFGEPTLFYIFNVLFHVGLGVVLIIPFSIYTYQYLGRSLQAHIQKKQISTLGQVGSIGIIVGIISGGYLMIVGATTPYRWLLITHIVSVSAGSILLCIHLLRDQGTPHTTVEKYKHRRAGGCCHFPDRRETYTTLSAE